MAIEGYFITPETAPRLEQVLKIYDNDTDSVAGVAGNRVVQLVQCASNTLANIYSGQIVQYDGTHWSNLGSPIILVSSNSTPLVVGNYYTAVRFGYSGGVPTYCTCVDVDGSGSGSGGGSGASVTLCGGQAHVSSQSFVSGSPTNISLANVIYDTNGFWNLTSSPTQFTINTPGYYLLVVEGQWSQNCESSLTLWNGYGSQWLAACEFINHGSVDYYSGGAVTIGTLAQYYGSSIFWAGRVTLAQVG